MIARRKRAGLTLIELVVSVAVLAMMLLIINALMVQSVRTVKQCEDTIKCDANARVISDRLREDISHITKDGFLVIASGPRANGVQQPLANGWAAYDSLAMTGFGAFRSLCITNEVSNELLIDYGLFPDILKGSNKIGTDTHVFRRFMGLGTNPSTNLYGGYYDSYSPEIPLEKTDPNYRSIRPPMLGLGAIKIYGRYIATDQIMPTVGGHPNFMKQWNPSQWVLDRAMLAPPNLDSERTVYLPPTDPTEVGAIWPYLAANCTSFTVEWTNGLDRNSDGSLIWYGGGNPKDKQWLNKTFDSQTNSAADIPEFLLSNSNNGYCALWTGQKRDNWPRALRIRFTILEGETRQSYETIAVLPN